MMEHHQTKAGAINKGGRRLDCRSFVRRRLPICDCIVANTEEISPWRNPAHRCGGRANILYFCGAATISEARHMNVFYMAVDITA
jgi:hypothetical protein